MHDGELAIDESLVAELIADQFPQWSDLSLDRVDSFGVVHALYRLGSDMAVRLPVLIEYAGGIVKEGHWSSILGSHLPLATPVQIASAGRAA